MFDTGLGQEPAGREPRLAGPDDGDVYAFDHPAAILNGS
jgi:hypothetical protein